MKKTILFAIAVTCSVAFFNACTKSSSSPTASTASLTLYDSLGGTTMVADPAHSGSMIEKGRLTIRSVVDSTIFVIAADTSINDAFKVLLTEVGQGNLSGFQALSTNLTDFICVGTGAKDFTYGGKSMTDAHNPATNPRMTGKADNGDFNSFEADLTKGAAKNGVPSTAPVFVSLAKIVESLRGQVVQM